MNDLFRPAPTPTRDAMKADAKRLRAALAESGHVVSHAKALDLLARQHGFRDWNTACARAEIDAPKPAHWPPTLGERARGRYLGQPFAGVVTGVQRLATADLYRLTLTFDEPVDVVSFDSFSSFRRRVTCTVARDGRSPSRTSNGVPHLTLTG